MKPHKITRICWNTNNWIKPSGATGKSKDIKSFEDTDGFGFEEWIFDFTKIIDGYIYGYVPAAGADRTRPTSIHGLFDLSFYTIENTSSKNQRWWIGTILDVEAISREQSQIIYETYKKNDWLKERFDQLKQLKINYKNYLDSFPTNFFNIRFRLKNIQLLDTPIQFNHKDPAVGSNYYNFLDFKKLPQPVVASSTIIDNQHQSEFFVRKAYTIEANSFNKLHSILHNQLLQHLQSHNNNDCEIYSEFCLENNTRIDINLKKKSGQYIVYEIKIARNLREVLRQALGQLLEYAFRLKYEKIEQLVIVSIFDINDPQYDQERVFLTFLNDSLKIPIVYQYIEIKNT